MRPASALLAALVVASPVAGAASLRFYGNGGAAGDAFVFRDRVKIRVDSPASPADVGATDVTIELWLKATAADNPNVTGCSGLDWTGSNILIDRDRYGLGRKFGIGLGGPGGGRIVFGVTAESGGDASICGTSDVRTGQWVHVAVQRRRSDGRVQIYVNGIRETDVDGPDGDLSYPDGAMPASFCSPDGGGGSQSCVNSDPFLVFGAEKHGFQGICYDGLLDEVRLSLILRYAGASAPVPSLPFALDASTAALWHLDEGVGTTALDATGSATNAGTLFFGSDGSGRPSGPVWSPDSPFATVGPLRLFPLTPCRALDTRTSGGPIAAGAERTLGLAGVCGVPVTARAIAANLTATEATANGELVLRPGDEPLPPTTTLPYRGGRTRANNVVLKLSADAARSLVLRNVAASGSVQAIVDVTGLFQ